MKVKTIKKLMALSLSIIMTASLLTACGNNAEESKQSSEVQSSQTAESDKTAATAESSDIQSTVAEDTFEHDPILNELGVEPICKEEVTITIGIKQNVNIEDYETNYFTQMIEEAAGVNIDVVLFPANEAQDKLQMMVAGGEKLPDIIMWGQTDAQAMTWGEEGYLLPLEDYFENSSYYAAQGYARVKEKSGLDIVEYMRCNDGHVWAFPRYQETGTNPPYDRFYIYQPWLEALDMEAPTTTDELYEVLKAFKTQDPNGNGKADEIPLIGSQITQKTSAGVYAWEYLMNAFQHSTARKNFLVSTDGQLSVSYTTDAWKEGVKYISKLVQEGLYDPLSFTQDVDTFKSIMNTTGDQLVGSFGFLSPSFIAKDHPSKNNWLLLPPLKGPDGYQSVSYAADMPEGYGYITSDCEHPEVAFRIMDLMCREDLTIISRWGKQGENWDYVENLNEEEIEKRLSEAKGEIVELDWENATYGPYKPTFYDFNSAWSKPGNVHWMNNNVAFRTEEVVGGLNAAGVRVDEAYRNNPINQYTTANYLRDIVDLIPKEPISKIKYANPDIQVEAELIQAELEAYVYEKLVSWFVGNADVEADWDSYLKELEEIGLSKYLQLSQDGWK